MEVAKSYSSSGLTVLRCVLHRMGNAGGVFLLVMALAAAAEAQDRPASRLTSDEVRATVGPGAIAIYHPERWGAVRLTLANSAEHPVELTSLLYFLDDPLTQYGRRAWVPPRSQLQIFHPLRMHQPVAADQIAVDLRTMLVEADSGREALIAGPQGELQRDPLLRLAARGPTTLLIDAVQPNAEGQLGPVSALELLRTGRYAWDFGNNIETLMDRLLPGGEMALDGVDHVLLADDRVLHDPAALASLRRWLAGGGRLWVLLDRVSVLVLEALLGDACAVIEVDRVGLTHVDLMAERSVNRPLFAADFDRPVELVRVAATDMETLVSVDGWPAALTQPYGRGRLVVTTLGAEAWVRPRGAGDAASAAGPSRNTPLVPNAGYEAFGTLLFLPQPEAKIDPAVAEAHVVEQVGYVIPSRGMVVGWLGGFTLGLAGIAMVLARRGHLEYMSWWAGGAALLVGGLLVAVGHRARAAVPATTALVQRVQAVPGTDDVHVTGMAGVYSPVAGPGEFRGARGGWMLPDTAGTEGVTRRLIWTDDDQWEWHNFPNTPGLRRVRFQESLAFSEPLRARVTLDEQGVVGRITLPHGLQPTDGILATVNGRLGVNFAADGTLTAGASQLLTPEQYLTAGVLSDEQRRRSRMLAELLRGEFPPQPTLLFWTAAWPGGLHFLDSAPTAGSALVSLPVVFERPVAGAIITIPATLLPYREAHGPGGVAPTGLYDSRKRQWSPKHVPSASWLQFDIPRSLLPLEPVSARLVAQVTGPMGKLEIAAVKDDRPTPFKTWVDPVGKIMVELTDPDMLELSAAGKLMLRVSGGDPDRPELTMHTADKAQYVSSWQIESLSLELKARVVE